MLPNLSLSAPPPPHGVAVGRVGKLTRMRIEHENFAIQFEKANLYQNLLNTLNNEWLKLEQEGWNSTTLRRLQAVYKETINQAANVIRNTMSVQILNRPQPAIRRLTFSLPNKNAESIRTWLAVNFRDLNELLPSISDSIPLQIQIVGQMWEANPESSSLFMPDPRQNTAAYTSYRA